MILLAQATSSLPALPAAAHIMAALGLGVGLTFWITGRRLLKPAFALLGALAGGMTGFLLVPTALDSLYGIPSPYIGLGIGALAGIAIGTFLFRFAVAITTGLALALAGGLLAATYLHFAPKPGGTGTYVPPARTIDTSGLTPAPTDRAHALLESAKPMALEVRDFVSVKTDEIYAAWQDRSAHDQMVLGVSSLGTGIGGFLLGMFAPRRSAAIATALFGSAIWMGCSLWLADALSMPGRQYLHQDAAVWLPAWLLLALVGFAVQVSGMGKTAKPAPEKE